MAGKPAGTSPDPVWKQEWERDGSFSGDYECGDYGKVVSAQDAAELADALERALKQSLPAPKEGCGFAREMTCQR